MSLQKIACAIYFLFSFSVLSAQDNSNSVFDAHRGGNITWLAFSNNHKLMYNIITGEVFQILENRKEKPGKFNVSLIDEKMVPEELSRLFQ